MGNLHVHAAQRPTAPLDIGVPPPPPLTAPPPTSASSGEASESASGNGDEKRKLKNPGAYDELHRKTKDVCPVPLGGCKLLITKGLSPHFSVNHTLMLEQQQPSSCTFGATYVGAKQVSPVEYRSQAANLVYRKYADLVGPAASGKAIMQLIGLNVGPPRLHEVALSAPQVKEMQKELNEIGFFDWYQ